MKYIILILVAILSGCASSNRCESYWCDYQRQEARKEYNRSLLYGGYSDMYSSHPVQNINIQTYPTWVTYPGGGGMMCNMGYCYGY